MQSPPSLSTISKGKSCPTYCHVKHLGSSDTLPMQHWNCFRAVCEWDSREVGVQESKDSSAGWSIGTNRAELSRDWPWVGMHWAEVEVIQLCSILRILNISSPMFVCVDICTYMLPCSSRAVWEPSHSHTIIAQMMVKWYVLWRGERERSETYYPVQLKNLEGFL